MIIYPNRLCLKILTSIKVLILTADEPTGPNSLKWLLDAVLISYIGVSSELYYNLGEEYYSQL
jgi:hypothetical protein